MLLAILLAAATDVHSLGNPDVVRPRHVSLDLALDFARKVVTGAATLDLVYPKDAPTAAHLDLDTRGLAIESVTAAGRPLKFALEPAVPHLGQRLRVTLPAPPPQSVTVRYRTSPEATALQWLEPRQTTSGKMPFLFTQSQAIHARSWIPIVDSPGVRVTYDAVVRAPKGMRVVMSAEHGKHDEAAGIFRFRMPHAIPPYLIALAAGELEFRPLSERTGVYAEPAVIDRAASEFVDVEKMVQVTEKLYGPYAWGRWDTIVLPPSFPFGGMENPRITFATPTVLAGDRSLVGLLAHELAHSWSGNLVTNATWSDFWLNEGFTSYFENRIMEALYGRERADMLANLGWQELQGEITNVGGAGHPDTRLHIDLAGRDPDAGMTEIAYEKGATFLRTLEEAVGRERWDAYLRSYFDRHAFQPMTTETFVADLRANLFRGDAALEQRIGVEEWVSGTGIPRNAVYRRSDAFTRVEEQARRFGAGTAAGQLATQGWTTQEWQHFLGALPQRMPAARLADLERAFNLSRQGNSEILFGWLMIAVRNRYEPALPALEAFLTGQGRRKFVRPLFAALMEQGAWGQGHARRIYAKARPGYHPVTSGSVDAIVK